MNALGLILGLIAAAGVAALLIPIALWAREAIRFLRDGDD